MTDHDALMRAICENPDDDTPRLVFADYLEENGQGERAAFIRKDIAAERLDEYDPVRVRWHRIGRMGVELTDWFQRGVPAVPHCNVQGTHGYRRGFPDFIYCAVSEMLPILADEVFLAHPFTHLCVAWTPRYVAKHFAGPRWPARLTALTFTGGEIDRRVAEKLVALPAFARLRQLHLNYAIRADGFRAVVDSPVFARLTALSLVDVTPARGVAGSLAAGETSALRKLDLTRTNVVAGLDRLLASPAARNLESLSLHDVPLYAGGYRALAAAPSLASLTSLELSGTAPGAGFAALVDSPYFARLRKLDLAGTHLNHEQVEHFAASATFVSLRELDLSANQLGNAGAVAIAESPHLAKLVVLDLSYTQTGDDGIRAILESPLADGLVFLNLIGSPASAEMKQAVKDRMGDRVRL